MIKTQEVIENDTDSLETLIDNTIKEFKITKEDLINIKYLKTRLVEPYYDDDGYLDKNSHQTSTITSALIIWDDIKE